MAPREQLQSELETILAHVYFQPPANAEMVYPCIRYERDRQYVEFADNKPYCLTRQYQLTIISRDPDEATFAAISRLPMCVHERFYAADNLNHDVFKIYF